MGDRWCCLLAKQRVWFCPWRPGDIVTSLLPLLHGFIYSAIFRLWLLGREAELPAFAPTATPGPKGAGTGGGCTQGAAALPPPRRFGPQRALREGTEGPGAHTDLDPKGAGCGHCHPTQTGGAGWSRHPAASVSLP